ncbi:MAG: protein-glutamate O-methyltransferase CheR [Oligoflexia bacterium]|nr:protein-glutamate O-methyltransferase CheR [Oligoflexia bacterium]
MIRYKGRPDDILTGSLYAKVGDLIYNYLGIALAKEEDIIDAMEKINPLLHLYKCRNIEDLFLLTLSDESNEILGEVANRLTTNYSYFYRERIHLDYLSQKLLPALITDFRNKRKYKLNIWSAACSTGEEAYTLSLIVREVLGIYFNNWTIKILATDISTRVLEEGKKGIYSQDKLKELPVEWVDKYFDILNGGYVKIKNDFLRDVEFKVFNLRRGAYHAFDEKFQIVFCRNVFIYFDEEVIDEIVEQLSTCIEVGGHLFTGVSETLGRRHQGRFLFLAPGVYQKI